jgi:DNA-3-methyladenine glycosylase I
MIERRALVKRGDDEMAEGHESGVVVGDDQRLRCVWGARTPEYCAYHDDEWGRPVVDDVRLYEKLCLEGFQSGLSWITILRKRESFRRAFEGFQPAAVAAFGEDDVGRLLADASIVRHQGKIRAAIANAHATLAAQAELGSLAALVWSFEPERASRPVPRGLGDVPPKSAESIALSKELLRRGFRFVGPTTCYAAMQALGIVNDHVADCWVRGACDAERAAAAVPRSPGGT